MENNHRQLIAHHTEALVESTDYHLIKQKVLDKEIMTQNMIDNIEKDCNGKEDKVKLFAIYKKLPHRGPKAFANLLEILKECDYTRAYNLLSQSTVPAQSFSHISVVTEDNRYLSISSTRNLNRQNSSNPNARTNNVSPVNNTQPNDGAFLSTPKKIKLEPYETITSFHIPNLVVKKAEKFGTHPVLRVYQMKSNRRGVFFFANIIKFQNADTNRKGAERDHDNLVTLFRELGFTVFYYENLTRNQLMDLLRELIKSEYLERTDSFFLCIQTHGDLLDGHTIMEFSDGSREYTDVIISLFSNIDCKALVQKPKVFIFPFCRGKISDKLKNVYEPKKIETDGAVNRQFSVPTFSDILIAYGTIPGFKTHRDTEFGSWYVRELTKVFAEHACTIHISELFMLVSANTMGLAMQLENGLTQVASLENRGFNNLLFLNPKIHEP